MEINVEFRMKHSSVDIFVCPERVFLIKDGIILDRDYPVDHKTEENKCSYCGDLLDSEEECETIDGKR